MMQRLLHGKIVIRRLHITVALALLLLTAMGSAALASRSLPGTDADIALAASPRGQVFVLARRTGLYRSTDRGRTWAPVGPQGFAPISVLAGPQEGVFYAVGKGGQALRSTDLGATWVALPTTEAAGGIAALAVEPYSDRLRAVTTSGYLMSSSDGGQTWQTQASASTSINLHSLAIDYADPDTLYSLSSENRFLVSRDGGASWEAIKSSIGEMTAIASRSGGREGAASHFACDCGGTAAAQLTSMVYAVQGGILYRSFDQGRSWLPLQEGAGHRPRLATLAIDPVNENRLYATLSQGSELAESLNGGRSWRSLPDGRPLR